jgi:hypothetical protein
MIRTAVGISLLILIAIYGIIYIKRESFTSTINFVTHLNAFQKMTDAERQMVMNNGARIIQQLDKNLLAKMDREPITNDDAKRILEAINNSVNKEFAGLINKYKLSSVDIISLSLYAINTAAVVDKSVSATPIQKQNLATLANFVKTWDPSKPVGKGINTPSVSLAPPPTFASVTASQAPKLVSAPNKGPVSQAPKTVSMPPKGTASSASLFSGSIPSLNDTVKAAVRDELRAAGLGKNNTAPVNIPKGPYAPGTSFSYDGGVQQKWQQNAACNARDWCCRCRRQRDRCQCQHF